MIVDYYMSSIHVSERAMLAWQNTRVAQGQTWRAGSLVQAELNAGITTKREEAGSSGHDGQRKERCGVHAAATGAKGLMYACDRPRDNFWLVPDTCSGRARGALIGLCNWEEITKNKTPCATISGLLLV
jgi:hypothetical protein